jgi:hypothetical protein
MHFMNQLLHSALAMMLVCFVLACSGGSDPKSVAEQWAKAAVDHDLKTLRRLTVEEAQALFDEAVGGKFASTWSALELGEVTITGDMARVAVVRTQYTPETEANAEELKTLILRNAGGVWRMWGIAGLRNGEESEMPLAVMAGLMGAFNESMGQFAKSVSDQFSRGGTVDELNLRFKTLAGFEPLSPDEYEAQWVNTIDFTGEPVGDVIAQLAGFCNLGMEPGEHTSALATRLTEPLTGLTHLEAIDRAAQAAGLVARFPEGSGYEEDDYAFPLDPAEPRSEEERWKDHLGEELPKPAIHFTEGKRLYPLAFAGPFVAGLNAFRESAAHGTAEIEIRYLGYGLSAAEANAIRPHARLLEQVAVSSEGNNLTRLPCGSTTDFWEDQGIYQGREERSLMGLFQDTDGIAHLALEIDMLIPQRVERFHFDELVSGAKSEINDKLLHIIHVEEKRVDLYAAWDDAPESLCDDFYLPENQEPGKTTVFLWELRDQQGLPVKHLNNGIIRGRKTYEQHRQQRAKPRPGESNTVTLPVEGNADMAVWYVDAGLPIDSATVYALQDFRPVTFDLTLTNLPLPESIERPAGFEELVIGEGHDSPLSIEVLDDPFSISDCKSYGVNGAQDMQALSLKIRVVNTCNKPIWTSFLTCYLGDQAGNRITNGRDSFRLPNEPGTAFVESPTVFLSPGDERTVDVEIDCISMQAKQVLEVYASQITFMDGTNWQPEQLQQAYPRRQQASPPYSPVNASTSNFSNPSRSFQSRAQMTGRPFSGSG